MLDPEMMPEIGRTSCSWCVWHDQEPCLPLRGCLGGWKLLVCWATRPLCACVRHCVLDNLNSSSKSSD